MRTDLLATTRFDSLLTSAPARRILVGSDDAPWPLVQEHDGTRYALGPSLSLRTADERREMLIVARYFSKMGATVFFLGDADRKTFEGGRPSRGSYGTKAGVS